MHSRSASNAAEALYSTFVLPALCGQRSIPPRFAPRLPQIQVVSRPFCQSSRSLAQPVSSKSGAPSQPPDGRRQRWNSEITARMVHLVDPATGELSPEGPRRTLYILNDLNTDTHRLVQLSPDEPGNRQFIPVCKIVNKKEALQAELRRKQAAKEARKAGGRSGESAAKTLELNWAIDGNDLAHRMDKMKEFLGEGRTVHVVLASKKRGRKATERECQDVLTKIRKTVEMVNGAKEKTPLEGKMGGVATISFYVVSQKGAKAAHDSGGTVAQEGGSDAGPREQLQQQQVN